MDSDRYAVLGCCECSCLWIHDRHQDTSTTQCRRCGTTHHLRSRQPVATADEIVIARELRSQALAQRADQLEAYDELVDDWATLEEQAEDYLNRYDHLFEDQIETTLDNHTKIFESRVNEGIQTHRDRFAERLPGVIDVRNGFYRAKLQERGWFDSTVTSDFSGFDRVLGRPSITIAMPGDQPDLDTVPVTIGPTYTEWSPGLIRKLLPTLVSAIETIADPDAPADTVARALVDRYGTDEIATETGVGTTEFLYKLAEYATADQADEDLVEQLVAIGTGTQHFNAGLPAFRVIAQLLQDAPESPTLRVRFKGDDWVTKDDVRPGRRTLAVLTLLATGTDVSLSLHAGTLTRHLTKRYNRWFNTHIDLTGICDRSGSPPDGQTARRSAITALAEISDGDGKLRMLSALSRVTPRQQRTLAHDPDIDLDEDSISAYALALEDLGLVLADHSGDYKRLRLTDVGEIATEYITDDYSIRDPNQATLTTNLELDPGTESDLTQTLYGDASTVFSASEPERGDQGREPSVEEVLAQTGDPDDGADYVQWLPGAGQLNAWAVHKRITAGKRCDGVTLVDDRIHRWGADDPDSDGRVTYVSAFEDELLAVVQWGGPLPTLARITATLLSDAVLSKVLTPRNLGDAFENVHDDAQEEIEETIGDILRWGHQLGWFSEDEEEWEPFRDRYEAVRKLLLEELGRVLANSDANRSQLTRDFHGIITSVTHLCYAAGIDVTINVRMPDIYELIDDDYRYQSFLDFVRYTVTKQTVFKWNSGYRMLLEDRPEKLKQRLSYDVESTDVTMDTTASWIFSGPTMTDLQGDIRNAIEAEQRELREAIDEGTETAPVMEIPITNGNSYTSLRFITKEFTKLKGYQDPEYAAKDRRSRSSIERLTRLLIQSLNTPERPYRACPHDIAEVFLRLSRADRAAEITVDDVEYGLSQLPPSRLFPAFSRKQTMIVQAFLEADEPLGRSAIIDRINVSESTYDRVIQELAALDIVEPRQVDGYRRWEAYLEPWWQDTTRSKQPYRETTQSGIPSTPQERDLVAELIYNLDLDVDHDVLAWPPDVEAAYKQSPTLQRYKAFIKAAVAMGDEFETGPPDQRVALVGRLPPGAAPEQLQLAAATGRDWRTVTPKVADGGVRGMSKTARNW